MQTQTIKTDKTMNTKKTALEVKVLAINTLNEFAAKIVEYEMAHFSKFIGQSIFKVDGSVKQKYDHEKLSFKGKLSDGTYYNVHYWFDSRYTFDVTIKICVNGGSYDVQPSTAFCQYEQITTELFKIQNGNIVESTREKHDFSLRYDVAELLKEGANVEEAAKAYEMAVSKIPHVFRDVMYISRLSRH